MGRKKMAVVAAFALAAMMALGTLAGCASPEQQAKDAAAKEASAAISTTTQVAGLDVLDATGISSADFVASVMGKTKAEATSVEVNDKQAVVTLSVKCPDVAECANLLGSKAAEFKGVTEIADMDKDARYGRAAQDFNESLQAAPDKTIEVRLTLTSSDGKWSATDDVAALISKAVLPDADKQSLAAAVSGYRWKFDDMNASQIVETLKADGMPIGEIETYDESTDPNGKLGRPGCYTSKTTFWDNRVEDPYDLAHIGGTLDNEMGGTVEVFTNVDDCKSRADYLDAVTGKTGIGKMYMYRFGTVLFRVTFDLLPSQAAEYEAAFFTMQG